MPTFGSAALGAVFVSLGGAERCAHPQSFVPACSSRFGAIDALDAFDRCNLKILSCRTEVDPWAADGKSIRLGLSYKSQSTEPASNTNHSG